MANTDHNPVLLDQVQVQLEAPLQPSSGALSPSEQPEASPQPPATAPAKDLSSSPADSRPNAAPARPTLVQLGSATSQPLQHHPPKKFNAVNINKKFLEQTSAAAALATASAASAANKSNSTICELSSFFSDRPSVEVYALVLTVWRIPFPKQLGRRVKRHRLIQDSSPPSSQARPCLQLQLVQDGPVPLPQRPLRLVKTLPLAPRLSLPPPWLSQPTPPHSCLMSAR
jgi:hypothetical protein